MCFLILFQCHLIMEFDDIYFLFFFNDWFVI